jgi:hypothetical protein
MPQALEDCVQAILSDPDFKPQEGRTREESAYAICQAQSGKACEITDSKLKKFAEDRIFKNGKVYEKRYIWMPMAKNMATGKYVAVLSDTSVDRDTERIGKSIIKNWADVEFLPALSDHRNDIDSYVGTWENRQYVESADNHAALIAEPKFFEGEEFIKGNKIRKIMDQGGQVGVSIGAIVTRLHDTGEMQGKTAIYEWDEAELLEASFVAVQSNRNAIAVVAKSFGIENLLGRTADNIEKRGVAMSDEENKDKKAETTPATKEPEAAQTKEPAKQEETKKPDIDLEALKKEITAEVQKDFDKKFDELFEKKLEGKKPMLRSLIEDADEASKVANSDSKPEETSSEDVIGKMKGISVRR